MTAFWTFYKLIVCFCFNFLMLKVCGKLDCRSTKSRKTLNDIFDISVDYNRIFSSSIKNENNLLVVIPGNLASGKSLFNIV